MFSSFAAIGSSQPLCRLTVALSSILLYTIPIYDMGDSLATSNLTRMPEMSHTWFVEHKGKTFGPMSSAQLKKLASASKIGRKTRVRLGDEGQWVPASKVQGLFPKPELLAADTSPPKQQALAHADRAVINTPPPAQPVSIPQPAAVAQIKPCMFCGENIALSAIKCKHCNEFLDGRPRETAVMQQPVAYVQQPAMPAPAPTVVNVSQVTNVGGIPHKQWSGLLAAFLSFIIPGLGQLYKGQVINGAVWFAVTVIGYVAFIIPGLVLHLCCILGAATGNPYR